MITAAMSRKMKTKTIHSRTLQKTTSFSSFFILHTELIYKGKQNKQYNWVLPEHVALMSLIIKRVFESGSNVTVAWQMVTKVGWMGRNGNRLSHEQDSNTSFIVCVGGNGQEANNAVRTFFYQFTLIAVKPLEECVFVPDVLEHPQRGRSALTPHYWR